MLKSPVKWKHWKVGFISVFPETRRRGNTFSIPNLRDKYSHCKTHPDFSIPLLHLGDTKTPKDQTAVEGIVWPPFTAGLS